MAFYMSETIAHPKIQMESKQDALFLMKKVKDFASEAMKHQQNAIHQAVEQRRAKGIQTDEQAVEKELKSKIDKVIDFNDSG